MFLIKIDLNIPHPSASHTFQHALPNEKLSIVVLMDKLEIQPPLDRQVVCKLEVPFLVKASYFGALPFVVCLDNSSLSPSAQRGIGRGGGPTGLPSPGDILSDAAT